ncbi:MULTISPECIES: LysR family transcriptional regulator [unclassified Rhizobium]|uniref:LysR family transcriptional regulator n=1 Tax=unclassified Rhizobium TaxID=2613769 RepID=UPI001ADC30B3|nr:MULTISPECIES: LysR family transcriptional regulator [unclassified Rhizobium]MBO9123759.1 LysR family transcriptional regulator [Rhizobium sp. 16-488-2b]MBO9174291.1 LysR family transcriptional regulator [Rhizobium sp. 16-488-2a]
MDTLLAIRLFVKAVEMKSLSAAGHALNMTPSSASRNLAALEHKVGASLLIRTVRHVKLTKAGQAYYDHVKPMLLDLDEVHSSLSSGSKKPGGTLRVSLPVDLGQKVILPAIPEFLRRFPSIQIMATLSDEFVDFDSDDVDMAVRVGNLQDSPLIAQRLASNIRVVCASPTYLAKFGTPETPQDLRAHNCLIYPSGGNSGRWIFQGPSELLEVRVSGTFVANNGASLVSAARQDMGIVLQPTWQVHDDLGAGRLVRILPDYLASSSYLTTDIYSVYPERFKGQPNIREFTGFLKSQIRAHPGFHGYGSETDLEA